MMPPMATKHRKKSRAPVSPIKGWQTITAASMQADISRQRIYILIDERRIPYREIMNVKLVPKPLPEW